MRSIAALLALAVAGALASDVITLTKANFDSVVNDADMILVKFYAPWCGHCKKLAPEYERAATILMQEEPPVKLAEVDADAEKDLGTRFGIQSFPTLKIFRKGVATPYTGPREADGIVKFMRTQNGPAAKPLASVEAFDKLAKSARDDVFVVGFFSTPGTNSEKQFLALASSLREDYRFATVSDAAVVSAKSPSGKDGVFVFRPFDGEDKSVEIAISASVPETTLLLHKASVPVAGVYKAAYAKRYDAVGLPRLTAWAKVSEFDPSATKYVLNRLRKAAAEFKGKLVFAIADKSDRDFNEMGFAADEKVVLGVIADGKRYKGEDEKFTVEAVRKLARAFLDGKLERHVKSEAVPATQEATRVVVGKTFEEEVTKSGKDVMLLFYAPWCGHCKSLHPKYDELAKKLAGNADTLSVAKIDATANEYPSEFSVHGYPTMYFVKASDPSHPIEYKGGREIADMESFIRENASKKLKTEL